MIASVGLLACYGRNDLHLDELVLPAEHGHALQRPGRLIWFERLANDVPRHGKVIARRRGDKHPHENGVRQLRTRRRKWTDEFRELRRDAAVFTVIDHLPAMPVFSSQTLQAATGLSAPPVDRAISQLVDRGIVEQRSVGRRNRAYEVPALIHASTLLERRLGSPLGDTRREPPSRSVPALPGEVDPSVADLY